MCNLYRMTKSTSEIANLFAAIDSMQGSNLGSEVYPGYPGAVVVDGEARSMVWGFPLAQKSKRTGEPLKPRSVNNARTDKLDSFMWRYSFEERRCLIPLTAWAEAEGPKGSKTRTWMSLPDAELFACAGLWRNSDEWGPCYTMVMTDAAGEAAEVHNRMPVILRADDYDQWQNGEPDEAKALCTGWTGPLTIERTEEPWSKR